MKKILTVSLFAIMAVSAANAEIASVEYVGKQTGALTDLQTTVKANLVGAINEVKAEVGTVSSDSGALKSNLEQAISNLEDAVDTKFESYTKTTDMTDAIATAKSEAITAAADDAKKYIDEDELTASQNAQNTTLQTYADNKASAAQTAAEKTAADELAAAKTELEGKITNASSGASTALAEALQNYTTTTDMTNAIATAKSQAIEAAADDAKKYIDQSELDASQESQDTTLKAYADNKASAAQAAAEATAAGELEAAKTELEGKITNASSGASTALAEALQNYTTTTDMTAAIATAKSGAETTAANALEAYKSTNDAAVVAAKKAGDDAQATADTKQDKSTSMSIGAADGAWTDLTKATGYSTTGTHSLVLKEGKISWEKVSY